VLAFQEIVAVPAVGFPFLLYVQNTIAPTTKIKTKKAIILVRDIFFPGVDVG
jgi:hypothetical protein